MRLSDFYSQIYGLRRMQKKKKQTLIDARACCEDDGMRQYFVDDPFLTLKLKPLNDNRKTISEKFKRLWRAKKGFTANRKTAKANSQKEPSN